MTDTTASNSSNCCPLLALEHINTPRWIVWRGLLKPFFGATMNTATPTRKITVATVKAFIRRNRHRLLVNTRSTFDGMQDMVVANDRQGWAPAEVATQYDEKTGEFVPVNEDSPRSLGLQGIWFVGDSGDRCQRVEKDGVHGYEVNNCCGSWQVGVRA